MPTNHQLPTGFKFAGVATNVKTSGEPDLALIIADQPCVAAGVYTQNLVHAASIDWNRRITPTDDLRAVAINSGNANACTGKKGIEDNESIAKQVARTVNAKSNQVLVLSTGVIGHLLPMEKVVSGIDAAGRTIAADEKSWDTAAKAILTTDKGSKTACRTIKIDDSTAIIRGMAKGAGMIGPNMATMLSVIVTDACLPSEIAQSCLVDATNESFNRISVEGHTSTNDSVLLLCSGQSNLKIESQTAIEQFQYELDSLCLELAKMIPMDGEGANHLVEISVAGARTNNEADQIARTVANSNLVKTAVAGNDPNWGRIVSAVGYCEGIHINATQIELEINGHDLFALGTPLKFDAAKVSQSMADNRLTRIDLSVGDGPGQSKHWTSDLTEAYVRFNSEYTT